LPFCADGVAGIRNARIFALRMHQYKQGRTTARKQWINPVLICPCGFCLGVMPEVALLWPMAVPLAELSRMPTPMRWLLRPT